MRVISAILNKFGYAKKRSGTSTPAQWLIDWVSGGAATSSGVSVSESSALKYTPFWSAVRIISGTIAELPFLVYRRLANDDRERAPEHPVYTLLHDRPNEYMDALTFIESRQAHVLTYGNGYAEIQRNGAGKPIALWPLLPDRTFRKITDTGVPYYEVRQQAGETVLLPDYNVLHIKGLGFDGYTGYNVVAYHKEAIGYGVAVKEYGARFFSNDGNPGGVLEHPGNLTTDAQNRLIASWNKSHSGLKQSHRMQVLEEGLKWNKTGVDPEQAQALEIQKYTVDDCSRIFNIPPHKLGSMQHATFSNIEEQNIDFVTSTMLYWFRKWELECNYKLFVPSERKNVFCELLVDGLLRGNMQAQALFFRTGRQWGYLSVNDIRKILNMNSIGPKGDVYLEPLNMKPAGTETPAKVGDNNRQAHRDLLISQWLRVIHKQANPGQKNQEYYEKQRSYAATILFEPVNAYGSLHRVKQNRVRNILNVMLRENINEDTKLKPIDAERLADMTMQEIGGNHAAT